MAKPTGRPRTGVVKICAACGKDFYVRPCLKDTQIYCKRKCDPKGRSILERFLLKFDKRAPGDCWLWKSTLNQDGYGVFKADKKRFTSARMAYKLFRGEIPEGLSVLHTCDVRRCVNPNHLYLGNNADNTRDRFLRGRSASGLRHGRHTKPERTSRGELHYAHQHPETRRGENNGRSRYTEDQVKEMRRLASLGYTQKAIGEIFGTSQSHAGRIITGKLWRHVM